MNIEITNGKTNAAGPRLKPSLNTRQIPVIVVKPSPLGVVQKVHDIKCQGIDCAVAEVADDLVGPVAAGPDLPALSCDIYVCDFAADWLDRSLAVEPDHDFLGVVCACVWVRVQPDIVGSVVDRASDVRIIDTAGYRANLVESPGENRAWGAICVMTAVEDCGIGYGRPVRRALAVLSDYLKTGALDFHAVLRCRPPTVIHHNVPKNCYRI